MTPTQLDLIRRFAWLCGELRAGNSFSNETLLRWETAAQRELNDGGKSVECPYCKWGFFPSVIAQHIREKHGSASS